MNFKKYVVIFGVLAVAVVLSVSAASATHSWNGYHWARTSNPFALKVGDNVSAVWDPYLNEAIADWSASSVLNLTKVTGSTKPRTCKPKAGQIEACSERYGKTGWLGIAQIWISGSHITQAITKVNDTYFNTSTYNTPAWRRLVRCQEIAHDFGLDHQDEDFSNPNLGSCMDYTSDPDGPPSNEHPNQHDYDQLETIYAHLDGSAQTNVPWWQGLFGQRPALAALPEATLDRETIGEWMEDAQEWGDEARAWGREVRRDARNRTSLYVRDLNKNEKVFTFVIWVDPPAEAH